MMRRPPVKLEEFAFASWLQALNSGVSIPVDAPTAFLSRALTNGAKLRESTIVRVFQAALNAGVEHLKIEGEIFNPNVLEQLARALNINPDILRKISLDLSPRLHKKSICMLVDSLQSMCNLREVRLTGGACDELLEAISTANPPIETLDLAYSRGVSDKGLKYLIGISNGATQNEPSGQDKSSSKHLKHLNLWETNVTTRGCVWVLQQCPTLISLSCQWTLEALVLLYLKKHESVNLEQLLICDDELTEGVFEAIKCLCSNLKYLTIRRPKAIFLTFNLILSAVPLLQDFTALQFSPYPALSTPLPLMPSIYKLHLSSLYAEEFDLNSLVESCPVLSYLSLEGLKPKVSDMSTEAKVFEHLRELRIITTFTAEKSLEPHLIVWIIKNMTKQISLLDLGCCQYFEDSHLRSMIEDGSLCQLEDLRLSGASNISNTLVLDLLDSCPLTRRVVFKMVNREKFAELETLKVELRVSNVDVELITYGHRIL